MKILHVSTYDQFGGAARAATRILHCQTSHGIQASMLTLVKQTGMKEVFTPGMNDPLHNIRYVRDLMGSQRSGRNPVPGSLRSSGLVSAGIVDQINASDCDIVHLHWIINMLSVEDIAAIRKPLVWTLHDMWPFCGAGHYVEDFENTPFSLQHENILIPEKLADEEDMEVWKRKEKCWRGKDVTLVGPSEWISGLARSSRLFNGSRIFTIPLPIDAQHEWYPERREEMRQRFSLASHQKAILCVAKDIFHDPRKGWELFVESLVHLTQNQPDHHYILMMAGPDEPPEKLSLPVPVVWLGNLSVTASLRQAYSMADVLAVPSVMEAFSLTSLEAQACGLPVVAFDNTGPAGIVIHRRTGGLAPAFNAAELATGIRWITQESERWFQLSMNARENAVLRFSHQGIAKQYKQIYMKVLSGMET